jgi:hypothetical protein
LIDDGTGDQFCWIKLAHRKAIQPRLTLTGEAPKPRASAVPLSDVDAVRTALAEEDDSHRMSLDREANKKQNRSETPTEPLSRDSPCAAARSPADAGTLMESSLADRDVRSACGEIRKLWGSCWLELVRR